MKRKGKIIFSIFAVIFFVLLLFWGLVNFIFIPRVVVPKLKEFIDKEFRGEVSLTIEDVDFHPFRGFIFQGVELSGPVVLKDHYILRADLVDIDLALLPLLRKRIRIKLFELSGVDLNIGRDKTGKWNFEPIMELDFMQEDDEYDFMIKKLVVKKCWIDYADFYEEGNTLERRFGNVDLIITNWGRRLYKLALSGGDEDRRKESIGLRLEFNRKKRILQGWGKMHTSFVGEYWDYYLDEIMDPWYLQADDINIKMKISAKDKHISTKGRYQVTNGILSYGNLSVKGNARIIQQLEFTRGKPGEGNGRINLILENIASLSGKYVFLKKGKCNAAITEKKITIFNLSGQGYQYPLSYTGKFTFQDPRELYLTGNIANLNNTLRIQFPADNKGIMDWDGRAGVSQLKLHADINNLKNMSFDMKVDGDIDLPDMSQLLMVSRENIQGHVGLTGELKGEADEISSLEGRLGLEFRDPSLCKIDLESFKIGMKVKDGVFKGGIPKTDFFKGCFYGGVVMDFHRWGLEFHIDDMDLAVFAAGQPELKGMKGKFTGSIAYVCNWKDVASLKGGGYFKLTDADLWNIPLFSETEKGIEEVAAKGDDALELPDLDDVEGNFQIEREQVIIENGFCQAKNMHLHFKGTYNFSGETDFTFGARFMGSGFFRVVRQVLLPFTIAIDVAADCVQVKITGKWPDLSEKATIKPVGVLTALFPSSGHADPEKYTVEKLWGDGTKDMRVERKETLGTRRRKHR